MKRFLIRFRYIPSYEMHTPLFHIPIEQTIVEADSLQEAWKKFITAPHAGNPSDFVTEEGCEELT